MEELRAHVRKYGPVMQRYYVQYLSGFDAVVLNELVQVSGEDFAMKSDKIYKSWIKYCCAFLLLLKFLFKVSVKVYVSC